MSEDYLRPKPEELLERMKADNEQKNRGKLKIFLGYAPGVGKTYTMLEAARQRKKDTDIAVAYVETHGRIDTQALTEGLEIIPRKNLDYRGVVLQEMDIDAVLVRRPQLAIVDELAHENAPGSRHPKRYQDVEELIQAGIDVYTTLNVQHIESGRNVVAQITGVWVRETVPDSIIDIAAEIELVDLPPDELIQRLKEGKVYVSEQIAPAVEKFFRKGNLTALRELAMRIAARHIDEQTLEYMKTHAVTGLWPSGERLLLYVGLDSLGSRLIRSARRLAHELNAEWTAISVETPDRAHQLSSEKQNEIADSLRMAQRLGAKIVTLQADGVAPAIIEYAKAHNITKIVAAKPLRNLWQRLVDPSVVIQIVRHSEQFDIHLISSKGDQVRRENKSAEARARFKWRGYLGGFGLVVLATVLGELGRNTFTQTTIAMLYVLSVVIASYLWGVGPAILVSIIGVFAFDFFLVPPYLTIAVGDTQYIFTFLILILVGAAISYLASRVRRQTEISRQHERRTAALYALGRELAMSNDLNSYISAITKRTKETFGRDSVVFLPDSKNKKLLKPHTANPNILIDEMEIAAAIWTYENQKIAGPGTDTLPNAKAKYLPLVTARGTVGVFALLVDGGIELNTEQERLLEAYADLAAVAIESIILEEEADNAQILRETEKLQTALLNAVSHDLRTPLVSIIGVLSSLQEEGMNLDESAKQNLVGVAREEAERLNHLITNILDISRIEAGAIKIARHPSDVQELIGAVLEQMGSSVRSRSIQIDIPADIPLVLVDFGLMVQTIINILDNALKYSPAESQIDIKASRSRHEVQIEIADRGIGIPPENLLRVFDKFYRIQQPDNVAGTGLGLSICKGIVEANGGRITAENRPGGGTIIRLILPVAEPTETIKEKPVV
jgi:two-component system, OmpR family, sensor histidine kinase KdpD